MVISITKIKNKYNLKEEQVTLLKVIIKEIENKKFILANELNPSTFPVRKIHKLMFDTNFLDNQVIYRLIKTISTGYLVKLRNDKKYFNKVMMVHIIYLKEDLSTIEKYLSEKLKEILNKPKHQTKYFRMPKDTLLKKKELYQQRLNLINEILGENNNENTHNKTNK